MRKLGEIGGPGVLQRLRRLHHFQRVADGVAQRLVHVGDQRLHFLVHAAADAHHGLRQAARIHLLLHERAAADLHVQHQRVHAFGQLLRHDGGGDQRDGFHRRGDVAQRVQLAVGGRQPVGLADEAQAQLARAAFRIPRRSGWCGSRESIPACRACRRYGPARGPTSSAPPRRPRPPAAPRSGWSCRPRRRSSACPPSRPGIAERSTVSPERSMHSVSRLTSRSVMPEKYTAIRNADIW